MQQRIQPTMVKKNQTVAVMIRKQPRKPNVSVVCPIIMPENLARNKEK